MFVSGLSPEDRCHLNGLGMVKGIPRYATALGATDAPDGWRKNKRDGGILMDIARREIIYDHLSMPHSPRWYNNRLWMLESGKGTLVCFDPTTGEKKEVAAMPGFTRGLDFIGPLAFVGLSQVRETAVFSDFPLLGGPGGADLRRLCLRYQDRSRSSVSSVLKGTFRRYSRFRYCTTRPFPRCWRAMMNCLNTCYVITDAALREVQYRRDLKKG